MLQPMIHRSQQQTKGKQKQVIIRLWGGLGNQMFQYAFGLSVAKALDLPLKADLTYFNSTPTGDTIRTYELAAFSLILDAALPRDLPSRTKTVLDKIMAAILHKPRFTIVKERQFYIYDVDLLNSLSNRQSLYLDGYWQCYMYIEHLRDELITSFKLKTPLTETGLSQELFIKQHPCISVHVRRGDYVGNEGAAKMDKQLYYSHACAYLAQRIPEAHFCIFSDDIEWCKAELILPFKHTFMIPDQHSAATDLYLMTLCKHHIIANSTFGWWGAWLANSSAQIVIAPKKWLSDMYENNTVDELIPSHWIRM